MIARSYLESPSYTPDDLAVLEHVLRDICASRKWPATCEEALQAARFLLAQFDGGLREAELLRAVFEKAMTQRNPART